MKKNLKRLFLIIITCIQWNVCMLNLFASEPDWISSYDKINLPKNLDFSVNNTCSGHTYFQQISAREDGWFAIATHYYKDENPVKGYTFRKQYIDLYDSNGDFVEEISFVTDWLYTIKLTDENIQIIFSSFRLVYNLDNKELCCYAVSGDEDQYLKTMEQMELLCGEWKYYWEKSSLGYKTITRNNGDIEQVVVNMPGTNRYSWWCFVVGIGTPTLIFFAGYYIIRKLRKK